MLIPRPMQRIPSVKALEEKAIAQKLYDQHNLPHANLRVWCAASSVILGRRARRRTQNAAMGCYCMQRRRAGVATRALNVSRARAIVPSYLYPGGWSDLITAINDMTIPKC
eukprot:4086744-Pleurochrysis_carterae.AAC.4